MKKILKISGISVAVILIATLIAVGTLLLIRHNNVVRTGNVLGVSWYSEGEKEFTISTVEQLKELVALSDFYSFDGQTIKLDADLTLNEGKAEDWKDNAPNNRWKPIDNFNGTFEGQGHTISGLYGKAHSTPMALFTNTGDECVIRNLKLVNSYMTTKGSSGVASFTVNGAGTLEKLYSDAIIDHQGDRVAGIASRNDRNMTINECWFDGVINSSRTQIGGIVDIITKGNTVINHSLFSGTINSTFTTNDTDKEGVFIGGICGTVKPPTSVKSNVGVKIIDCLSSGEINTKCNISSGSVIGYVMYGGNSSVSFRDTYTIEGIANAAYGASTGTIVGKTLVMREKEMLGIKAYQWTTLNFDRYWVPVEGSTPVLRCFAENPMSTEGVEKEYDTSWYNSAEYVFDINDRKDLYGLALLSVNDNFAGKRVNLNADIVLNEGKAKNWEKNEPEYPWIPITDFNGMFDGKGHSVSGIYLKTSSQYQGFFTTVQTTGVVKDLSIKNSYFCSTNKELSMIGSIAGDFRGKLDGVYSNAIVVGYGPQIGGLIARANDNDESGNKADKITLTNCWFDGEVYAKGETTTYAGGLVSAVIQGDLLVEHCLNTGTIHSECTGRAIHVAGLIGSVSHVEARLVMKDCLNAGMIDAAYDVGVGSVIGRLSSEKHSANLTNVFTTEESHIKSIGTSSGTIKGGAIRLPESIMTGKSGYRYTTLDFEKYWTTVSNDTPMLRHFTKNVQSTAGLSKAIDISWYNDDAKTFTIKNLKQFYGFAFLATGNNFEGKTVKLGADITVNTPNMQAWKAGTAAASNPWVSIGNAGMEFNGTFDGQGHVIRGIYVKSDTQYTGLFGRASYDSVIKNFKLVDSYFCNTNKELCMTGSIAGEIRGRMENVYSNATVIGYAPQIGGMVARINDYDDYKRETKAEIADKVVVKNCWFDGEVVLKGSTNTYAGGVVGALIQGDLEMTDCLNTGKVVSQKNDTTAGATLHVGGVLGSQSNAESRLVMKNCLNTGSIVTEPGMGTAAGAVLGRVSGKNHTATITNVFASNESYANVVGWSNGIVNGKSYVDAGANNTAGTSVSRTQLLLRTDAAVKAFFGPSTSAWTCDTVNNGLDRGTPILKYFANWWIKQQPATKEASDTSWYNTTNKEFEISTPEQFNGLAELSAKYDFAGQTFKLTADLQMNSVDDATLKAWAEGTKVAPTPSYPIGSEEKPFAGTFDGQGHTISGLYMSTNANGAGLFGVTAETASFKDFKLVDSYLSSNGTQLGGIVGKGAIASMENIYVNATVKTTNSYAGGFVGQIKPNGGTTYINNCWFDGEMIQVGGKVHSVGGFIGNDAVATPVIFKNCLMTGKVSGGFRVGGFYGWKNNYAVNEFYNCLSVGTVKSNPAEAYVEYKETGSYFGCFNTSTYNLKFYNSYASGKKIIGVYKTEAEAANFEISAYLKDRDTLIATGEKTLFPALSGESKNAWVDDIGCNTTDRGTPILEMFADDWFAENPSTDLDAMPESKTDADWYNETDTTFTITTVEEFLGFAELVNAGTDDFAGKTVKLGANIVINEVDDTILAKWKAGTEVPEVEWRPIGTSAKPFAGTFDGQGYSISGLFLDARAEGAGLFGYTAGTSEFKNFKFIDSYLKSNSASLGMIGVGRFTNIENIYTNATFESSAPQVGGFVGVIFNYKPDYAAIYSTIKNCWFDGTVIQTDGSKYAVGGFIGGTGGAASLGFYNCLSTGTVTGGFRTGGFYGWRNYYALIDLHNCLSVADVSTNVASGYESYAHLAGSFFGDFSSNTYNANMYNSYGVGDKINGSQDWPKFETTDYIKTRTYLIETGEKKLFPALVGEGKNAWVNDIGYNDADRGTPILETFADWWLAQNPASGLEEMPGTKADTSWYNETDTTFVLTKVEELLGFAELVNDGKDDFAGKAVKLGANIKLNDVEEQTLANWIAGTEVADIEWSPVGTSGAAFAGTFDGQGYEISGLYLNATSDNAGLFGYTAATAVLKDFKLVDSYMTSNAKSLGLVGRGTFVSIENVYSNAILKSTAIAVGGFVGTLDASTTTLLIKNCWFDGEVLQTGSGVYNAGGFIADDASAVPVKFVNCLMTGSVTGVDNVGGFYGFHSNYAVRDYYNCLSVGTVSGTANGAYVGGVVGNVNTSTWNVKMYNTYTDAAAVIGRTKTAGETDKYNTEIYMMLREDLIAADEKDLFPVLAAEGETENAWVNDLGYNEVDRGTPVLSTFAEWWFAQHSDDELQERPTNDPNKVKPSTEWFTNGTPIMNAADLLGFAKLASEGETFAGKTVKLGADIALNEVNAATLESWKDGSITPSNVWTPVGTAEKAFAGIFDGQGYTISGLYLNTTTAASGIFGTTAATAVIKNFKLVESYMKSTAENLGIVGAGALASMENIYTNAVMVSNAKCVAGFAGTLSSNGGTTYFKNCWFDGEVIQTKGEGDTYLAAGFLAQDGNAMLLEFDNCLSTGKVTGVSKVGGFMGWLNTYKAKDAELFKNCLSVANVTATGSADYCGSYFGQFNTSPYGLTLTNSYAVGSKIIGVYRAQDGSYKTAIESDKYIKTRDYIVNANETELFPLLTGETENAWVQDPYWNNSDRGTPILATFAEWWLDRQPKDNLSQRTDTKWHNNTDTTFTLKTPEELLGFAEIVNSGKDNFAGKTVKLGADIALNEVDNTILQAWKAGTQVPASTWTPIGNATTPFAGTFDGQGYTISGIYLDANVEGSGLFGRTVSPSEFKNFKLVDSVMKNSQPSLGIIGKGSVVLMENIYTDAIMISSASDRSDVAGFIGTIDKYATDYASVYTTIRNCWFDGYVQQANTARKAGGFIAGMSGAASIGFYNCLSTGTVTGGYNIGGFFGAKDTYATCETSNCLSVATVIASPTDTANASKFGSYYGDHTTSAWNSKMYTSYAVNKIVGNGNNPETGTLKTREELVDADVKVLFPESTAWQQDPYWNNSDRGTPILATFAEWWLDRQQTEGLSERIDTSWYSESGTEFVLTKEAQLIGFAELSKTYTFAGQIVKLGADIVLNETDEDVVKAWKDGTKVARNLWTPIGTSAKPFAGTFDGQGYTISGLYLNATTEGSGMFGTTAATAVIKNFKLVESYMKSTAVNLGIVGVGALASMENIYTNAVMVSNTKCVAGFAGTLSSNGGTTYFKNCWFDGEVIQTKGEGDTYLAAGFLAQDGNAMLLEFDNCLSTGKVTGVSKVGGFMGWLNTYKAKDAELFKNCLSVADVTATGSADYCGSYFGQFNTSPYGLTLKNSYAVGSKIIGVYRSQDGSYKTAFESATYLKTRDYIVNANETDIFPALTGETENAWVQDPGYNAVDRGTPILATFATWWLDRQPTEGVNERLDTSWFTGNATTYTLTTPAQLMGLAKLSKTNDFKGITIKLGADITLNDVNEAKLVEWKEGTSVPSRVWSPIGTASKPFAGTFDGQGHTISGLYLVTDVTTGSGLFGNVASDAIIKDFSFVDSYIKAPGVVGMIGKGSMSKIEKVYVDVIIDSTGDHAGGFVGETVGYYTSKTTGDSESWAQGKIEISDCWFAGEVNMTGNFYAAAGFIAYPTQRSLIVMNDCMYTGSVTATYASARIGGFFGWINSTAPYQLNNCLALGTLSELSYAGGIAGQTGVEAERVVVTNCHTTHGSIIPYMTTTQTLNNCSMKTEAELKITSVSTLFPNSTAWEAVTGSTPVLKSFK